MRLKGLIFKELYLARKNYLITFAIWFMLALLGILIQLSIRYGNLASLPADDLADTESSIYYIWTYLTAFLLLFSSMTTETIFADFTSKWSVFRASTPVSEYKYTGVRYIINLILVIFSLILSLFNAAILCHISGRAFNRLLVGIMLIIVLICVLLNIFGERMAYKYRDKNKMAAKIVLPVVIIYTLVMGGMFYLFSAIKKAHPVMSEEELTLYLNSMIDTYTDKAERIIDAAVPFLPFIIIATFVLGYFSCVGLMKRRDF